MAKKRGKAKGKKLAKVSKIDPNVAKINVINSGVIAAAYSSATNQSVFMKLCRLCESKDGPFLNIFDADKITAKKIEELMPFKIAENDDLPHKICFRCSAKVEEFHEFIQKCIKTQENLQKALGNMAPLPIKTKTRAIWEEKLNKSNISNDDICDALIKKAMEGIKDIPLKPLAAEDMVNSGADSKRLTRSNIELKKKELKTEMPINNKCDSESLPKLTSEIPEKLIKTHLNKADTAKAEIAEVETTKVETAEVEAAKHEIAKTETSKIGTAKIETVEGETVKKVNVDKKEATDKPKSDTSVINLCCDYSVSDIEDTKEIEREQPKVETEKPFNIMDHVSMIRVMGVGVLFQCKLCNRNFVKKEVVESHNCAKNGFPKIDLTKTASTPEPPKVSTVKYIKMDPNKKLGEKKAKVNLNVLADKDKEKEETINLAPAFKSIPSIRTKPRIGPASKVKKIDDSNLETQQGSNSQESNLNTPNPPSVIFPALPSLNGRYKLMPGPNNTFTLVEETSSIANTVPEEDKTEKKRISPEESVKTDEAKPSKVFKIDQKHQVDQKNLIDEKELGDDRKPYPVGLFQTMPHHSKLYEPPVSQPPTLSTPAMKKQSYTVVQTGNPSKLLISTKPQPVLEEVPKKRHKKNKSEEKIDVPKEPFKVTLEDVAPPKDSGFFTFINVDPLLQPSYVLPTDNIIQESQISTSTTAVSKNVENKDKGKYTCNMCGENFSREKKLLAHIQSHYTKMDEEDLIRTEKSSKKRGRKQCFPK